MADRKFTLIIAARDATKAVFGRVRKGLSGLGGQVKKVFSPTGLLIGGVGAFGLGALGKSFIDTASSFEDLEASLSTTLGSIDKAREAIKYANEEAAASPYTVLQYGEAIRTLSAYGIQYRDVMRTLGDTAASMNKPLEAAVEALADALQGEGERLKEFGIKQSVAGDQITYTWTDALGNVRKTIAQNNPKIIQETLAAIWNEKYKGGMEKFGSNWSGLTSTAESLWDEFKLAVMESGVFDLLKNALQTIIAKIQEAKKTGDFKKWAQEAGQALLDVGKMIITTIPRGLLLVLQAVHMVSKSFLGWKMLWAELKYQFYGFMEALWGGLNKARNFTTSLLESMNVNGIFDEQIAESKRIGEEQQTILRQVAIDRKKALSDQQAVIQKQNEEARAVEKYKAKIGEMQAVFDGAVKHVDDLVAAQKKIGDGTKQGVDQAVSELDRYIAKCKEAKRAGAAIPTDFRGSNYGGSVESLESSISQAEKTE